MRDRRGLYLAVKQPKPWPRKKRPTKKELRARAYATFRPPEARAAKVRSGFAAWLLRSLAVRLWGRP